MVTVKMLKLVVLLCPDSYKNNSQVPLNRNEGLKQREQISDDIVIYDVTEDVGEEEHPMADEENLPVTPETSEDTTSDSSK